MSKMNHICLSTLIKISPTAHTGLTSGNRLCLLFTVLHDWHPKMV